MIILNHHFNLFLREMFEELNLNLESFEDIQPPIKNNSNYFETNQFNCKKIGNDQICLSIQVIQVAPYFVKVIVGSPNRIERK